MTIYVNDMAMQLIFQNLCESGITFLNTLFSALYSQVKLSDILTWYAKRLCGMYDVFDHVIVCL